MDGTPLMKATMEVVATGTEHVNHVDAGVRWAQAQVHGGMNAWTLHLTGDPTHWRHIAKVIEDAAMEAERLMADALESVRRELAS